MTTLVWSHLASYAFGGAFLTNAIPHFVTGVSGGPFQSPFAKPPGVGLSSSVTNVIWGSLNFVVAYVLLARVGDFTDRDPAHLAAFGLGAFVMAVNLGYYFGKFHGGRLDGDETERAKRK